uniref:Uncharacterized protein n=1 Tax=Globodera pallida TaxID=36090 RepID=A0A183BMC9_GLOPA
MKQFADTSENEERLSRSCLKCSNRRIGTIRETGHSNSKLDSGSENNQLSGASWKSLFGDFYGTVSGAQLQAVLHRTRACIMKSLQFSTQCPACEQ